MSDLSFTIVEELGHLGSRGYVHAIFIEQHGVFKLFQIDWLTQPRIDKIKTFASACQRSSFLQTYACNSCSGAFISYPDPRFQFQPKTVNKWFSVSVKGDGKEMKINVINVDQDCKTRKCYTTQNQCKNFPWSLQDLEDYEVCYHGTGHKAAKDIITGAIDLARGRRERDFSSGNGCCLGKNFDETLDTKFASDKPPTSAVLVFLAKKGNLTGPKLKMKGLTLKPGKKWKEVFRLFRTH